MQIGSGQTGDGKSECRHFAAADAKSLQSCLTLWPHRRQPTRLPCPWDSSGNNTGVCCHFLLQWMKVKSGSEVAQSCPTPSDRMDCSPPGSSVHGIFQARVLEWVAIAFSIDSLGISKLKWAEMDEFNSDDHYIYYCGQESLEETE